LLTNDFYQTNMPGVHAIGDCVGGQALAHVASAEGIICVEKIAGHHPEPFRLQQYSGLYLLLTRNCIGWLYRS
jgi:dihydrolipoamide dehydrogenase